MLNGVHLVDFGNHRNTRLTFGRMTALVGQNGAGKTTLMRAIEEVFRAGRAGQQWEGLPERFRRNYVAVPTVSAAWDGTLINQQGTWGVLLRGRNETNWFWR